ncbi:MAG: tRNA preQ1(34) S-adenosylmethionine ribosyltransferase-isomerase QueA [Candidatus Parcubacteria bacterium]|nr:tRNA preQ1(34) S-adenosylmethionine ribosyltransferase-isomerase QueA [Candidatus Parcubacteria bacterium]
MLITEFNYELPPELIAQDPLNPRPSAKLMVLDRRAGQVEHYHFSDLPEILKAGDILVLNDTKVIPARLMGQKALTGGHVEVLLLQPQDQNFTSIGLWQNKWLTIGSPRLKLREEINFSENLRAIVKETTEIGSVLKFNCSGEELRSHIYAIGEMPIPPYIKNTSLNQNSLQKEYQTVYAQKEGSVAAPTAGLHFDNELLEKLKNKGVQILYITLNVGFGTFKPIKVSEVSEHKMDAEYYEIRPEVAAILNTAKKEGKKIIAVGTTATRTLESASNENGELEKLNGWTSIFIYPGYRYKFINQLITNFHLPNSTPLMLTSAFAAQPYLDADGWQKGRDIVLSAYKEAIKNKYRFYSFGDGMLIK